MRTLIWKELRENLKWAILAMIALGGAEVYALYQTQSGQPDYYDYYTGITLCRPSFLTITSFGCAGIGLLLGLIQVLPELKRDRWAALLHRPVPRGVIFWGKAVAGSLLYLLATLPPFLLCVWLAATPGHFAAPFVPGLALAGTADTVAGLAYYGAALAAALEQGGWLGRKALPLLAAIHLSYVVGGSRSFEDAAVAAMLMIAALGLAAWGAMQNPQSFGGRPWAGKAALLFVAFYGFCGLGDLLQYADQATVPRHSRYARYELSDEGDPLKLTYVNDIVVSVEDLEGRTPKEANFKPDRIRNHIHPLNTLSSYIGDSHGWHSPWIHDYYRESNTYIEADRPFTFPRLEQWFYLVKQRNALGVLPNKKVTIARFDARGFEPISANPVPLPPGMELSRAGEDAYRLWDAKSLRVANLASKTVTELSLPVPGPIYGAGTAWTRHGQGSVEVLAAALGAAVAVYDEHSGKLVATLPYHREMDRWGCLELGVNSNLDRFYLTYNPSMWTLIRIGRTMPAYLEEMNAQGQVLRSYTLPPLPNMKESFALDKWLTRRVSSPAWFFGPLAYQKVGAEFGNRELRKALDEALGENWPETRERAKDILVFSVLCAGFTLWWARRMQLSWRRAWPWVALTFALNIAGLLIFRCLADRPRLVPCSVCQRRRPLDGEHCPQCGQGWPEIARNGTEIFDGPGAMTPTPAVSA